MGIHNLNKFLKKNTNDLFEEISLSDLQYMKVAIDISLYLYKYKRYDDWIMLFVNLICCLRKNSVHSVFIFDGKSPPEKDAEKQKRREQTMKTESERAMLLEALTNYECDGTIDTTIPIFVEATEINPITEKPYINKGMIEDKIKKLGSSIVKITEYDIHLAKELFDVLSVPYFTAPGEAETMCADLCKRGHVDAVLSEDTDVLALGAPIMLQKLNTKDGTCIAVCIANVIDQLSLTQEEFLDLCIMCGTDFNKNIYKIGPEKAYKYILEHRTIDEIGKSTNLDISILNHVRTRDIFQNYEQADIENVLYSGKPDYEALERLIFDYGLNINTNIIRKSFASKEVEFED